ncbi:MAG: NfeD family protein [Tidjanibacter sp.]|jgi:membrane protein implicated in regulation of membrane protease activity|nr:NfeD family protein [Tidjanibacter sp.]MBQ5930722.1 NfeD family protein [Tidjanibacter sp.]
MEVWHYWALAAIILIVGEILTSGFALICFAVGAIFGAVGAAAALSIEWQIGLFAIGTVVAFLAIRPLLLKLSQKDEIATNADALIGRIAKVSEEINPAEGTGRVAIDGDDWKAESEDDQIIEKGAKVVVTHRESIILTVKKQ